MPVAGARASSSHATREHVGLQVGIGLGRARPLATARPSGVAGSTVSAYALMCSGASAIGLRQRRAPTSPASRPPRRRSGRGSRCRSRRARAASNAARTRSGEWSRSSDASTARSNDCAPIDNRSYPASRRARERRLVDGVGVRLGRDLRVVGHVEASRAGATSSARQILGRLHRGRAAAQEHARDLGAVPRRRRERTPRPPARAGTAGPGGRAPRTR